MRTTILILIATAAVAAATPAQAYIGPGLGVGTLAAIGGFALSVLIALFAIVWYPLKRMLGLKKKKPAPDAEGKAEPGTGARA